MENQQPPINTVNIGGTIEPGSFGLVGWIKQLGNVTAMMIVSGCFLWLFSQYTIQARQDRMEDRQIFRDAVRDLQTQADRHTGELKAAMDANTAATLKLDDSLRKLGHEAQNKVRSLPPEK